MSDRTTREPFSGGWTGIVALALFAYVALAIALILVDGQGGRALEVFNLYSDSVASVTVAVLAAAAARGALPPAPRRAARFMRRRGERGGS
jgi:hypothetical protein